MAYTNSSLVSHTHLSPNHSGERIHPITRISIHCVVGQCSVESLGNIFANRDLEASSNYGIGYDGRVGLYVEEKNRSWCTSSYDNDNRAVTIEVASDTYDPYRVKDAAYKTLIQLVADICRRNGKTKVLWFGDKAKSLEYSPKTNEIVLTVHRWFANKSCPGDYLYNLHPTIVKEVNALLAGAKTAPDLPAATASTNQNGSATFTKVKKTMNLTVRYLGQSGYQNNAAQVKTLQILLNANNCFGKDKKVLTIDGSFGANTAYAVKTFQTKKKLTADGIVGPVTWKALIGSE